MAGNCSVACATGTPPWQGSGEGEERPKSAQASASEKHYAAESSRLTIPNILWSGHGKNPPNCVFFACHPQMPAVFTC
jgi:hypothetical protein